MEEKRTTVTDILDDLDDMFGEGGEKIEKSDREAVEILLYPPLPSEDLDSGGDSASDDELDPTKVLSKLSRNLLKTDAELIKKKGATEKEEEEEDYFSGWTLAEVQKASTNNNLEPAKRKSRLAADCGIPAGGNVDPQEGSEDSDEPFTMPSKKKTKSSKGTVTAQGKRKSHQVQKALTNNNHGPAKRKSRAIPAGGNVDPHEGAKESGNPLTMPSKKKIKLKSRKETITEVNKNKLGQAKRKSHPAEESDSEVEDDVLPFENPSTSKKRKSETAPRRHKAAIPAGENVEAAAAIPAGENVEAAAAIPAGENVEARPRRKSRRGRRGNTDEEEEEVEEVEKEPKSNRNKEYDRIWNNDSSKVGTKVGSFNPPENSFESDEVQSCRRPYEFFRLFTNEAHLTEIVNQSRLYAHQNGKARKASEMNIDSLLCLQAVMLLSGYNKVPDRRMYWQDQPDSRCPIIYDNIRRDTLDNLVSILHFVDNDEESSDRFKKLRPLFRNINETAVKYLPPSKKVSVDEIMVPYYGPHGDKQYIRGKPVRFGFKIWSLCTSSGSIVQVEPYCGSSTRIQKHFNNMGPDVVVGLVTQAGVVSGSEVYFDNLFTSIPLMVWLSSKGIGGTGTLNTNRMHPIPLAKKKEVEKKWERGQFGSTYHEDVAVTCWKDNKPVYICSNKFGEEPLAKATRWSRMEKKVVDFDQPNSIKEYNKGMGGVDLVDAMTARYRGRIRSNKWWWCIWNWSVSIQAIQAWRLMEAVTKNKMPYLEFLRPLVLEMLEKHGTKRMRPGRPLILRGLAGDGQRRHSEGHLIVKGEQKRRCSGVGCSGRTSYECIRCQVGLHPECFFLYHSPEE